MRRPSLLLLLLCASGCSAGPRAQPRSWIEAYHDRAPREVLVRRVWDDVDERLDGAPRDARITHFIEVELLGDGSAEARFAVWPYDAFALRHHPPRPGAVLVVAPREWLVAPGRD